MKPEELVKEFKGFVAVNGVSLNVQRGHIHALIGPRRRQDDRLHLLTKFLIPTRGQILFNGHDITPEKPSQVARRGIVRSFQISATFPPHGDGERAHWLATCQGTSMHFWRSERSLNQLNDKAMALLDQVDLGNMADLTAVELPYGRKRALEMPPRWPWTPS